MVESITVVNEVGQTIKINIIARFKIEEYDKEYLVYTINDDGVSEEVTVFITGVVEIDGKIELRLIPEEEKEVVLAFYDNLRDTATGER